MDKGGRPHQMNFRVSTETKVGLEWLAHQDGITMSDWLDRIVEDEMNSSFNEKQTAGELIDSQSNYSTEDARRDGLTDEQYADAILETYDGPRKSGIREWLLYLLEPYWKAE